jgi:hypothetical protein
MVWQAETSETTAITRQCDQCGGPIVGVWWYLPATGDKLCPCCCVTCVSPAPPADNPPQKA